jgi:YD repeat-containing protein
MLARIIWVTARKDATPEALPKMSYDDLGRPIEIKDAKCKSTFYSYYAASRVTGVTDANGNSTGYNYTASGNLSLIEIIEMNFFVLAK